MLPETDALESFVLAAKHLSFRAAADEASVTPAALGKRIQLLERRLGTPLFRRSTRRVELTEAGLALLPRAREALAAAERCVQAARGEIGPPPVELVLGTRHELGLSWIVPLLGTLEAAHPHVTFHLYFGSGPDLETRLRTAEIDAAIFSRQVGDPRLVSLQLHPEEYVFVGHRALLRRTPLRSPAEALAHTLLDAHAERPLFRYLRDASPAAERLVFGGFRVLGTTAAIRLVVLARGGVAVLPRHLVRKDLAARRLVPILPRLPVLSDHFRLVFRADDPRRTTLEAIAETLRASPLR